MPGVWEQLCGKLLDQDGKLQPHQPLQKIPCIISTKCLICCVVTTMKSLLSDRVIYTRAKGTGKQSSCLPIQASFSISGRYFILIVWGWFAPLKTSTCLATSPQDTWVTDVVGGLCLYHMSPNLYPCLLLVRLLIRFSSAPESFLHSNHEPRLHRCCSAGRSSLAPEPHWSDQPGAISIWLSLGPAHPCAQGPIQEGWGLQHGHASRRKSWMFAEQALGFGGPQMLSTLRSRYLWNTTHSRNIHCHVALS